MAKFEKNFQTLFLININPSGTENLVRLATGINNVTPNMNEETDDTAYLDGEGSKETEVTGIQRQYDFSGSRVDGDDAQDFIAGLQGKIGDDRKTTFKVFHKDGSSVYGDCSITSIVPFGGDSNAKSDFSFSIMMNGKTTDVATTSATALDATISAGTTAGTTIATVTVGTGNSLFYKITDAVQTANSYEYDSQDDLTAYTSGDEIEISADEYLNLYEMNEYKRIVKFDSHLMTSGEIGA